MQLRRAIHLTVTFLLIAGQLPPPLEIAPAYGADTSGTAEIQLIDTSATATQTGDTAWTLEKTGSLSGNTVTWNITANSTPATSGELSIQGHMTVFNFGSGPATIGNIVVNLQKRVGKNWVTQASDIADATDGDDATTAKVHSAASSEKKSTFSENSASGALNFMDATNNTIFSLVPQVLIGAGQSRSLLFQASFDNNVLKLATGALIRAEVIVSFGNASARGNSTANVDINGNGTIDTDEARIRSVPSRLTLSVPAPVNGNGTVALTDTLDDITATGDVTFSNVNFDLGATSGTVTANVNTGTNGGSITNCAHLTGNSQTVNSGGFNFPVINGVDLQACSTVQVAGNPTCTPGAPGCGWANGDMQTGTQLAYGTGGSTEAGVLGANFNSVFGGLVVVGGTFTMIFTNVPAILTYLPAVGAPAPLTGSLFNPLTTSSGELGGQVLALQFNVELSAAYGNAVDLGTLRFCNYVDVPALNDKTVDEFLAIANHVLGGGATSLSFATIATVAGDLNSAFSGGTPSSFAQATLVAGACTN